MMRSIVSTLILLAVAAGAANAQSLEAARDNKLRQAFTKKAAWTSDFDVAKAQAKKNGKAIFVYFTVSYDD